MKMKKVIIGFVLACFCSLALAVQSPLVMMQGISDGVLAGLSANKTKLKSNPSIISNLVHRTIIPHVDVNRMAGTVLGRQYWNSASAAQKAEFVRLFTQLVISTYSSALSSYDDDKMQFYPLRGGYNQPVVQVNSVIIRKNGQTIAVNYNLEQMGGGWKIYDFVIENISMVQSYNSQFASTLAAGGLPALLQKLQQRNNNFGQ